MNNPIHILALGAGVQSSTVALKAAHKEITPMPAAAIFADTQDEPASVYKWLDWLEKQLPFPVERVTAGSLSKHVLALHKSKDGKTVTRGGIPAFTKDKKTGKAGIGFRQCTHDFKVVPLTRAARRIAGIKRGQKSVGVITWIGISLDEVHRMKTSPNPWQLFRYPLIDLRLTRNDCLIWMVKHGYPTPPRSACVYCPYHSDDYWRKLRDGEPEEFAKAVQFDKDYRETKSKVINFNSIPYLHSSLKPLDEVDFATDEDRGQQVMFGNECEGLCGI